MPKKIKFTCYLQEDSICFPELNESICNEMGRGGDKGNPKHGFFKQIQLLPSNSIEKEFVLQIVQYKPA
jgi:hypothetical protein